MTESKLFKLIKSIEYGTNLHINVVFLKNEGNLETDLPLEYKIHSRKICDFFKSLDNGNECLRCRNTVLKYVARKQKPISGLCFNGIYEYCNPVIINGRTVCVVFVGHILPENTSVIYKKLSKSDLINELQKDFSEEKCRMTADVISSYIEYLIKNYEPKPSDSYNPLIENIKSYLEENLTYDFDVSDVSKIFNYNDKYLGKLFKQKTGIAIKEYVNLRRIEIAEELLKNTFLTVTDISIKIGFNNVTYFNRIFKKLRGVTPTQFRNSQ